jgi:hypothetical protein
MLLKCKAAAAAAAAAAASLASGSIMVDTAATSTGSTSDHASTRKGNNVELCSLPKYCVQDLLLLTTFHMHVT